MNKTTEACTVISLVVAAFVLGFWLGFRNGEETTILKVNKAIQESNEGNLFIKAPLFELKK